MMERNSDIPTITDNFNTMNVEIEHKNLTPL